MTMARGRKPLPAAVRRLQGNRSKTPIVEGVVVPPGQPLPPWPLSKDARREWDRLCHTLGPAGVLTTIDADALATWAEAIVTYHAANRELIKHGVVVAGVSGAPVANPAASIAKAALATMARYQSEFGATPSARMRVKGTPPAQAVDPFDQFVASNTGKPALPA